MKREFTADEQEAAENIFRELVGFTVEQAKFILKEIVAKIDERAVIEEAQDN